MEPVQLYIDGLPVEAQPGWTIMEAARMAGIYIPGLCSHPDLPPGGICRLCVVEVEGRDELAQSCETLVVPGMMVYTGTRRVRDYRQDKLMAILANHPHACLTCAQQEGCSRTQCSSNVPVEERCCPELGNCEVQRVAGFVGIKPETPRYRFLGLPVVEEEPLIRRDYNLCIGCLRCVRVCRDIRGVGALQAMEFQGRSVVSTTGTSLAQSHCRFCTACVAVCPTGALTDMGIQGAAGDAALVPCRHNCPAGIDVPWYVRLIATEQFDHALAVIRERVPFPATLGRVCFHPCETGCRRGFLNQPVSICRLKRFVADQDSGWWRTRQRAVLPSGRYVAVVGAGPAGLTAAYYLARQGHDVTVFEAQPVAGGMTRLGIPPYRLPRDVLEREVGEIAGAGVRIKTNHPVRDAGALLAQGFHAVLLATGTQGVIHLGVPGEDLSGVYYGAHFLRGVSLGEYLSVGPRVVIIGGGNVAIDAARTALRLGAETVTVYCMEADGEMPAFPAEVAAARQEGVCICHGRGVHSLQGAKGKVEGVTTIAVAALLDGEGLFNPSFIQGTEEEVPADTVIIAIGQRPEINFLGELAGLVGPGGYLIVDPKTMGTTISGIFACGDAVTGPKSVIEAIAAGRTAASAIDRYLGGDGVIEEELVPREPVSGFLGQVEGFAAMDRHGVLQRPWQRIAAGNQCPAGEVLVARFGEVELGLLEDMAVTEASRCLRCDLRLSIGAPPFPPDRWLPFNKENVARVPEGEGVYQLLDNNKKILAIVGTANLHRSLAEQLEYMGRVAFFGYEEDPMYTSRESQLIQQFLQQHGHLPEGVGDMDDLF